MRCFVTITNDIINIYVQIKPSFIHDTVKDTAIINTMLKAFVNKGQIMKSFTSEKEYQKVLDIYANCKCFCNKECHIMATKACLNIGQAVEIQNNMNLLLLEELSTFINLYGIFGKTQIALNIFNNIHKLKVSDAAMNNYETE